VDGTLLARRLQWRSNAPMHNTCDPKLLIFRAPSLHPPIKFTRFTPQEAPYPKGAITSKIKHAMKLKTSLARIAQLLQPSLSFCFSLQSWTSSPGRYAVIAVIGCKLKQNANEGCNSCASLAGLVLCFIACYCMFYFTCDRSLRRLSQLR